MIVRHQPEVQTVNWGNGTSSRMTTFRDGRGHSINDTTVFANTESRLQYTEHIEEVYCVAGYGWVIEEDGTTHAIMPGTIYVLDKHDAHILKAGDEDWRLICVFSPGLNGDEVHSLSEAGYSGFKAVAGTDPVCDALMDELDRLIDG